MTPIEYGETTRVFGKNQDQYSPLPARVTDTGEVVSCWKLSFRERLSVLFRGRIFLCVWTFNRPLQPVSLGIEDPIMPPEEDEADES